MAAYPPRKGGEWHEVVDKALSAFIDEHLPEILLGIAHKGALV
jgi:hypothetical protein